MATRTGSNTMTIGVLAGLAGGIVFGMMMLMMGSLAMIAKMIGSDSTLVGFLIHLMISAVFGAAYGLFAKKAVTNGSAVLFGMGYGVILWIVGPLLMMPLMMGMPSMVFHIEGMQWMSLMGHIIYGVATALVFLKIKNIR